MKLEYATDNGTTQPYVEYEAGDSQVLLRNQRVSIWSLPCQDIMQKTGLSLFMPPVLAINGRRIFYADPQDVIYGGKRVTPNSRTIAARQVRLIERGLAELKRAAENDDLARELQDSLLVPCPKEYPETWLARGKRLGILWGIRPKGAKMVTLPEALSTLHELKMVARSSTPWVLMGIVALCIVAAIIISWLRSPPVVLTPVAKLELTPGGNVLVGQVMSAQLAGSGLQDAGGQIVEKAKGRASQAAFQIDWGDGAGFADVEGAVCLHTYLTAGSRRVCLKVLGPDGTEASAEETLTVIRVVPVVKMQIVPGREVEANAAITVNSAGSGYEVTGDESRSLYTVQEFREKWPEWAKNAACLVDWGDDDQDLRPLDGESEEHRYLDANSYDVRLVVRLSTPVLLQAVETQTINVRRSLVDYPRIDPVARLAIASIEVDVNEPVDVNVVGSGYRSIANDSRDKLLDLTDLEAMKTPGWQNAKMEIDWGDGSERARVKSANARHLEHQYVGKGVYTIRWTVRGPDGRDSEASTNVGVRYVANVDAVEWYPDGTLGAQISWRPSEESTQDGGGSKVRDIAVNSKTTNITSDNTKEVRTGDGEGTRSGENRSVRQKGTSESELAPDNSRRRSVVSSKSGTDPNQVTIPDDDSQGSGAPFADQVVRVKAMPTYDKGKNELRIEYQLPADIPNGQVSDWRYYLDGQEVDAIGRVGEGVKSKEEGAIVFQWSDANAKTGLLTRIQSRGAPVRVDAKAVWTSASQEKRLIVSQQSVESIPKAQTDFVPQVKDK